MRKLVLVLFALALWPVSDAVALDPVPGYRVSGSTWYETKEEACEVWASQSGYFRPHVDLPGVPGASGSFGHDTVNPVGKCHACATDTPCYENNNGNRSGDLSSGGSFCPANSTLTGGTCSCDSGFTESGGACVGVCSPGAGETQRVKLYAGRLNDVLASDQDIRDLVKNLINQKVSVDGCQYVLDPEVSLDDLECGYGVTGIVDLRVYCEVTLKKEGTPAQPGDLPSSDGDEPVCPPDTDQGTVNGIPKCLPRSGAPAPLIPHKSVSQVTVEENPDGTVTETTVTVHAGGTVSIDRVTRDPESGQTTGFENSTSFAEGTGAGAAEDAYSDQEGVEGGAGGNAAPVSEFDLSGIFSDALGKPRWWESSCLDDDEIEIYGHTFAIPWSAMCTPLDVLGRAMVIFTLLWGVSFVIRGVK